MRKPENGGDDNRLAADIAGKAMMLSRWSRWIIGFALARLN